MAEIDVLLSASLKRSAQPGDVAGVADAIRARVAAGDTGAPAAESGFGGGSFVWLPWLGLVVVAGLVGGSLAPLGVFGAQIIEVQTASTAVLRQAATAHFCIGGPEAATMPSGQRVLATARSEDATWLGVRDPLNVLATLWVSAAVVTLDEGQDASALPMGGACPVVETTLAVPQAPNAQEPAPGPGTGSGSGPSSTPDTTAPSISVGSFSPQPAYGLEAAPYCDTQSTVTVTATDDVAIASVAGSANTAGATVQLSNTSGSNYVFLFFAPYASGPDKIVTVTFVAVDTSGNQVSAPRTLVLRSAGNCLI